MGRISAKDAIENYKSFEGNDFFSLKNDMDTATVRFLYDDIGDLDIYFVHEVMINGKKRWIECLEKDCPLCKAGNTPKIKMFIQLLDLRDNKIKTWERGPKFIPKMQGLFKKYGPISNRPYDVERHGKPKESDTTYELYALDKDDKTVKDLGEKQELEGEFILLKTDEEMQELVSQGAVETTGNFGNTNSKAPTEPTAPVRHREKVSEDTEVF